MYRIYADGELLHAPHLVLDGCGVFSPKLTEELNRAGSLDYVLPPNNTLYDKVGKLKSIITVTQHGEEIFRGRVLYDEKDFYKQKKTTCEGELNFLLDSRQRPYKYEGTAKALFTQYINNHNARVEAAKRFTVGNITVDGADSTIIRENESHAATLDEINTQLIDMLGGYLRVRGSGNTRYIDWLADSGDTNTQTIEFGVNLLDLTEYISAEEIYTVLIPVGASLQDKDGNDNGKLDISSVNNGKDYLENTEAIALFGRIESTIEWSEVEDASELKKLGEAALKENLELAVSLTVKAVDLHILNPAIERLRLGDWVQVISLPHGLNKPFQCTKIAHDLVNPDQTEYTFGVKFNSLTEQQVSNEKFVSSASTVVQSATGAATRATQVANQANQSVQQVVDVSLPELDRRVTLLEEGGGGGAIESADHPGCYYRLVGEELEWINPPMVLNTEYRMEERYLGKPVYAMLFDYGTGPAANAVKRVNHGIANIEYIVGTSGVMCSSAAGSALTIPYYNSSSNQGYLTVTYSDIRIGATGTALTGYTDIKVLIKYTKTTD